MVNKQALMERCGEESAGLLELGCKHVFVVWDLRPAWPNDDDLDCVREAEFVREQLGAAGVRASQATLLCITKELEVWLLADPEAIRAHCSRPTREAARVPKPGPLERIDWPKKRVEMLCEERGRRFTPHLDALRVIQNARREWLREAPSYARFEDRLVALCPRVDAGQRRRA